MDPEVIEQVALGPYHVPDREVGEKHAVGLARGSGILAGRTGRTLASAQAVRANHEKLVRVDRFARANDVIPPTWLSIFLGIYARNVVITGQGVTNENGVASLFIQFAISFIFDPKLIDGTVLHLEAALMLVGPSLNDPNSFRGGFRGFGWA
tara:strand:+ start:2152 stop:2607 length:456 start_codon:yes stop_codon:yes gene_type:complete